MLNTESEFIERADYIDSKQLIKWNVDNPFFSNIQKKLTGVGAKLIVGPRGSGKTHQMKLAFSACMKSASLPFPILVSFTRYLRLEPFLRKDSSAATLFQTWVLCKITVKAIYSAKKKKISYETLLPIEENKIDNFISRTEKTGTNSTGPWQDEVDSAITIASTISFIEKITALSNRKRTILLLDDAAITLTPEYMIEFFEIFRSLKTRKISPKASVYPGTTEYGPRFHVGHDAEPVPAWLSVDDSSYNDFMESLCNKRLYAADNIPQPIVDIFKYASFGIPRSFIFLVRSYLDSNEKTNQKKFNDAIEGRVQLLKVEYLSIGSKVPQYKTIINTGWLFFEKCLSLLKEANSELNETKNIIIGIEKDEDHKIKRMMKFLIEAGLLYEMSSVSHGENRIYFRYIPHLLFLIKKRTFSTGRGFDATSTAARLGFKNEKHPLRRKFESILDNTIDSLQLDSPPCRHCKTPRIDEKQKFCHNCGAQLMEASIFETCMQIKIKELPITEYQKKSLADIGINVIGDYYTSASPSNELRKAKKIGKKRAPQIYETTERFLEEFLDA